MNREPEDATGEKALGTGGAGWHQFLTAKRQLIRDYQAAKEYSQAEPVRTSHGFKAEASFRKWLASFLPKRFGVTPGKILSQRFPDPDEDEVHRHYDVIIYDQLNSPILWTEDDADKSDQGKVRAIPAEHVYAVLEIKSRFTPSTAREAIEKLAELKSLSVKIDTPNDHYPIHFPPQFCCCAVFFELTTQDASKGLALQNLLDGIELRGYFGALILSGEGLSLNSSGEVKLLRGNEALAGFGEENMLYGASGTASREYSPGAHFSAMLMWSEVAFASFAFDLMARMNGTYRPGFVSSFHGMRVWRPE
jgi:hypothetical protein